MVEAPYISVVAANGKDSVQDLLLHDRQEPKLWHCFWHSYSVLGTTSHSPVRVPAKMPLYMQAPYYLKREERSTPHRVHRPTLWTHTHALPTTETNLPVPNSLSSVEATLRPSDRPPFTDHAIPFSKSPSRPSPSSNSLHEAPPLELLHQGAHAVDHDSRGPWLRFTDAEELVLGIRNVGDVREGDPLDRLLLGAHDGGERRETRLVEAEIRRDDRGQRQPARNG